RSSRLNGMASCFRLFPQESCGVLQVVKVVSQLECTAGLRARRESTQAYPRHYNSAFLASILLIAFLSCRSTGQTLSNVNQPSDVTGGVVINGVTHEPVGHALVVSGDSRLATMTDAQGHFDLALPDSGSDQPTDSAGPQSRVAAGVRIGFGADPGMLYARKP